MDTINTKERITGVAQEQLIHYVTGRRQPVIKYREDTKRSAKFRKWIELCEFRLINNFVEGAYVTEAKLILCCDYLQD